MLVSKEKKSKVKPMVSLLGSTLRKSDESNDDVKIERSITTDDKDKAKVKTSITVKT